VIAGRKCRLAVQIGEENRPDERILFSALSLCSSGLTIGIAGRFAGFFNSGLCRQ
jgi:hypothetical protein